MRSKTDPIKRGSRLHQTLDLIDGGGFKNRPDQKGIKTKRRHRANRIVPCSKTDPIKRGSRRAGTTARALARGSKTDPIKRGSRPPEPTTLNYCSVVQKQSRSKGDQDRRWWQRMSSYCSKTDPIKRGSRHRAAYSANISLGSKTDPIKRGSRPRSSPPRRRARCVQKQTRSKGDQDRVPGDFRAAMSSKTDPIKRGSRQGHARVGGTRGDEFKNRPDQKGIKTVRYLQWIA